MNAKVVVDWVWREEHEYSVTEDLPADWEGMDNDAKLQWLEQFDSTMMDSYPIAPIEVLEVEEIY